MNRELKDVVNKFGAYIVSMMEVLNNKIDTTADLIYGTELSPRDSHEFNYVALPIKNLEGDGLDKDSLDKLYAVMAFFVDNALGSGNIYLTQRKGKLVIEIAWTL